MFYIHSIIHYINYTIVNSMIGFVNIYQGFLHLLKSKRSEIKIHVLAWSLYYLIDFAFVVGFTPHMATDVVFTYFSTIILYSSCFYFIVEINKKYLPIKKVNALLISILSVFVAAFINCIWDLYVLKYHMSIEKFNVSPWNLYLFETWRFSTAGLYAFAYWIYLQRVKEQKLHRETEKQLYYAEVAFLKAQINPHFLFNTLNFVYSDVAEKSTRAGNAIMSLTKLLRYSVESTKHDNSSLRKEVEAITEYLVLQDLRFDQKNYVEFTKSGLFLLFAIPPLILLSLVENAFKYGIIDNPEHPIKINLTADKDSLNFKCKNLKRLDFKDKETTSVGLENIQRRLKLTFEDDYKLLVNEDEYYYEVDLNIIWKK
jgi:two-component system LytT family sensor kinase